MPLAAPRRIRGALLELSKRWKALQRDSLKEKDIQVPHGTYKNLDKVRRRILGMKSLADVIEVFSEAKREESRENVILREAFTSPTVNKILSCLLVTPPTLTTNRRREDLGVITTENQVTPVTITAKFMKDQNTKSVKNKEEQGNHVSVDKAT